MSTTAYGTPCLGEKERRYKTIVVYGLVQSDDGRNDYKICKYYLAKKLSKKVHFNNLKAGKWYTIKCNPCGDIVSITREKVHPPEELVPPVLLDDLFEVDRVDEEIIDIDVERW